MKHESLFCCSDFLTAMSVTTSVPALLLDLLLSLMTKMQRSQVPFNFGYRFFSGMKIWNRTL